MMTREEIKDFCDMKSQLEPENEDIYKAIVKILEQEPTTKNDLGVECIDRAELLKAMDTWDKFGYSVRYGLERLDKNDKGFVPYVKYDDMVKCVKGMSSVTPQEPRIDFEQLKRKIRMEVDGGTDDAWLAYGEVCDRIRNSIDEFVADMRDRSMTREEALEFIAQSVKSDVDMALVADAIIEAGKGE